MIDLSHPTGVGPITKKFFRVFKFSFPVGVAKRATWVRMLSATNGQCALLEPRDQSQNSFSYGSAGVAAMQEQHERL